LASQTVQPLNINTEGNGDRRRKSCRAEVKGVRRWPI